MRNLLFISLIPFCAALAQADFIVPNPDEGVATEFAGWSGFTDPNTDWQLPEVGQTVPPIPDGEGNLVNEEAADNTDALLIQNGTEALVAGSGGIYSNTGEDSQFVIFDQPGFEADSVLLQVRSIGNHADLDSAQLFYRTEEDGLLQEAIDPAGNGFLFTGSNTFTAWEWDLSAVDIFDYFLVFRSLGSSMSLQEVWLDTFDTPTSYLGFALTIETNHAFASGGIGEVKHNRAGETESQLSYQVGDLIELEAVADSFNEHEFVGWRNGLSGSANPAQVTMAEGLVVEAIFGPQNYNAWASNIINPFVNEVALNLRNPWDADPDNNGLINLLEYALGGWPETLEDEAEIRPRPAVSAEGEHLQLQFKKQIAATDITYRVKVSNDLQNWYYNGDGTGLTYTDILPETTFNDDGTETVIVQDRTPIPPNGRRFMVLEVVMNEST